VDGRVGQLALKAGVFVDQGLDGLEFFGHGFFLKVAQDSGGWAGRGRARRDKQKRRRARRADLLARAP
jgi:hypothetical protein